ncbi:hypothetical protein ACLPHM_04535 [Paenalcaligenes sp. Me131]|uniref:hypothetical protein n=1 Tax=Paenalcaligenes sp. Me131 TaxID=3392636 RepID=UPI003D2D6C5A
MAAQSGVERVTAMLLSFFHTAIATILMQTLVRTLLALISAVALSVVVAGLFLPVASVLQGAEFTCLSEGITECVSWIPMSAVLYGPLFAIVGAVVGTPLLLMLWAWRGW